MELQVTTFKLCKIADFISNGSVSQAELAEYLQRLARAIIYDVATIADMVDFTQCVSVGAVASLVATHIHSLLGLYEVTKTADDDIGNIAKRWSEYLQAPPPDTIDLSYSCANSALVTYLLMDAAAGNEVDWTMLGIEGDLTPLVGAVRNFIEASVLYTFTLAVSGDKAALRDWPGLIRFSRSASD